MIRHVVIKGRVQGVGYREWTRLAAIGCGLAGWVRNRRDGTVEAVFSGDPTDVAAMVAQCRSGPSSAIVSAVEERAAIPDDLVPSGSGPGFSILPTV